MKPFGVVRSIFQYTGYFEDDQNPNYFPLNRALNLIFWIGTWYYSLPALCFFVFAAHSFLEYSDSFYFIVDGFLFVFIWPIFLSLKSKFIELIADYEELIEKRMTKILHFLFCRCLTKKWIKLWFCRFFYGFSGMQNALLTDLYVQTDQSVEHLTTRFHFAMTRFLLPSFTLPMFFASMIAYFSVDGPCPECFLLSFPAL